MFSQRYMTESSVVEHQQKKDRLVYKFEISIMPKTSMPNMFEYHILKN
jgi:hypothetical protein